MKQQNVENPFILVDRADGQFNWDVMQMKLM